MNAEVTNLAWTDTPEAARTESALAQLVNDFYRDDMDYHQEFIASVRETWGFYDGSRQWFERHPVDNSWIDKAAARRKAGLPVEQINLVFPIVNLVCGIQAQEPLETSFLPRTEEDSQIAEAKTEVIRFIHERASGARRISQAFKSTAVTGRGWIGVEQVEDEATMFGTRTALTSLDADEILYDRRSKEHDLTDCDHLLRFRTMSMSDAVALWPDKAAELRSYFTDMDNGFSARVDNGGSLGTMGRQAHIVECYYRVLQLKTFVIDPQSGMVHDVSDLPPEQLGLIIMLNPETKPIRKRVKVMKFVRTCGTSRGVVLDSGNSPYDDNYYPYVPFWAYRSRDKDFGVVDQIMEPQRAVNKRESSIQEWLGKAPRMRVITSSAEDAATFRSEDEIAVLTGQFQVVQPPAFPASYANLSNQRREDVKRVSGISDDLQGIRQANEPGIVVGLRQKQGMAMIASLFDQLQDSHELLTKIEHSRMRQFMPESEIARIIGPTKAAIPGLLAAIKSRETEDYDVKTIQSPSAPTVRIENWQKLEGLLKMPNVAQFIPPDLVVEASDVPQKDQIIAAIKAKTQQPPPQVAPSGAGPVMRPANPGAGPALPAAGTQPVQAR